MSTLRAAALAATLLVAAVATSAHAQDGDSVQPWSFEARALDLSAMLKSQHGGQRTLSAEVPLARAHVRVLVRTPGRDSTTLDATTDLVGRFVLEGPEPPPGATLEFFVAGADGAEPRPGYYGRPWTVDDGDPPATIEFYEVATQPPEGLLLGQVINVVSVVDRDLDNEGDDDLVVQLRHTAMLVNQDFRVWMGDLSRNDFATFGIRIPEGFELKNVTVNNQTVDATDVGRSGHGDEEKWLFRSPIFPAMQRPIMVQAMFSAPYEDGREYDISWHNEYPVERYTLNLEQGRFTYLPPSDAKQGAELVDVGINPAMGNTKIVTHGYALQRIPPHQTLSARFVAGTPFPWKAVTWTGAILLVVAGAGILGFVASRPRVERDAETKAAEKRVKVPETAAGREHELEMLDRRLRRGEITSVEHQVRKAAIERAQQQTPAAPSRPPRAKATAPDLDAIAARIDDAGAQQLRDDVRALLAEVRRLSGER